MTRRWPTYLCIVAFACGMAVRFHNALHAPLMRGYDAFAHFGYIWFLAEEGRVPPATAGWEFFQPPAYYAFMLAFWNGLPDVDALLRLRLGTAVLAVATVLPACLVLRICRRSFPDAPGVALLAAGLVLFLPVHLYSAAFLGNESLCAVLCSLALGALLWTLERETVARCIVLGITLGLAMLTKFTAVVVVAAAMGTLALRALRSGDWRGGLGRLAVVGVAMLLVCGWFYGRNLRDYGNPFQLSREQLFLSHIEDSQLQGRRGFLEYVLFDPVILYRPQWPRGLSLDNARPPDSPYSAMRESVPTGLYANTWFDGFGGFVLPRITDSELSRRAGQLLLTLGMVPTLLMLAGFVAGITRLRREGWNDTVVVMLLATLAMAGVVVLGTRSVPTHAAVKATYLMPISVAFAFWFALGFDLLRRLHPALGRIAASVCVLLAVVSGLVFSDGLLIGDVGASAREADAGTRNLHGMIYAAAGERERARDLFESSARDGSALAQENLADFALEENRLEEALDRMRLADAVQSSHGRRDNPAQRAYLDATLAEYANTQAVILYRLGRTDEAFAAVHRSLDLDPKIPEAHFNLGVLLLTQAARNNDAAAARPQLRQAREAFANALALDPAFREAQAMAGVAATLEGECTVGAATIRDAMIVRPGEHRAYPLLTGPGDHHGAARHRRRRIEDLPPPLQPAGRLRACEDGNG